MQPRQTPWAFAQNCQPVRIRERQPRGRHEITHKKRGKDDGPPASGLQLQDLRRTNENGSLLADHCGPRRRTPRPDGTMGQHAGSLIGRRAHVETELPVVDLFLIRRCNHTIMRLVTLVAALLINARVTGEGCAGVSVCARCSCARRGCGLKFCELVQEVDAVLYGFLRVTWGLAGTAAVPYGFRSTAARRAHNPDTTVVLQSGSNESTAGASLVTFASITGCGVGSAACRRLHGMCFLPRGLTLLEVASERPGLRKYNSFATRVQASLDEAGLLAEGCTPSAPKGVSRRAATGEVSYPGCAVSPAAGTKDKRLDGAAADLKLRCVHAVGGMGLQRRRQAAGARAGQGTAV